MIDSKATSLRGVPDVGGSVVRMDMLKSVLSNDTVQEKVSGWFGGDKDDAEGEGGETGEAKAVDKDTALASNSTSTAAPAPSTVPHAPRVAASPEMSSHTASGSTATTGLPLTEHPAVVADALPGAVADSCLPAIAHRLARLLSALQHTWVADC